MGGSTSSWGPGRELAVREGIRRAVAVGRGEVLSRWEKTWGAGGVLGVRWSLER